MRCVEPPEIMGVVGDHLHPRDIPTSPTENLRIEDTKVDQSEAPLHHLNHMNDPSPATTVTTHPTQSKKTPAKYLIGNDRNERV